MLDLTFSGLDSQISQIEAEMAQLQQQISQKKAIKKALTLSRYSVTLGAFSGRVSKGQNFTFRDVYIVR